MRTTRNKLIAAEILLPETLIPGLPKKWRGVRHNKSTIEEKVISEAQFYEIMRNMAKLIKKPALRRKCIQTCRLEFHCGLRLNEALHASCSWVIEHDDVYFLYVPSKHAKRHYGRNVLVPQERIAFIRSLVPLSREPGEKAREKDIRRVRFSLNNYLKRAIQMTTTLSEAFRKHGLNHVFRHSYAHAFPGDIAVLQASIGHKRLTTTIDVYHQANTGSQKNLKAHGYEVNQDV